MHGLWPGAYALPSRHPPSVLDVVFTTAQIQNSTTLSPQLPWLKLSFSSYRCRRWGGTMPSSANSATKIAVSTRWNQPDVPFSGQDHVAVSSRARIEARIVQGTITVTAMSVPATRNRVRHLPLADAPGSLIGWGGIPMARMRGRRMARRGGASGLWSPFWHGRRQARHVRRR